MDFFTTENILIILGALLALSEVLALIPGIKSNSVFQLIVNIVKKVKEFISPKPNVFK
jgi:hypothetical protein